VAHQNGSTGKPKAGSPAAEAESGSSRDSEILTIIDEVVETDVRFILAARLVPLGWEYWDMSALGLAYRLWSVIWHMFPDDGSAESCFMDWLYAHIDAFEDYWRQQPKWSGPLKVRQLA